MAAPVRLRRRGAVAARRRLGTVPLLLERQSRAGGARHARLHVRAAPRLRRDHIAAIDNTTRKLAPGRKALARRRVLLLARPLHHRLLARRRSRRRRPRRWARSIPGLQTYGGYVGASVSGTFLCIIGVLNLIVLRRHPADLPRHAPRRLRPGASRAAAARPRLHEPLLRRPALPPASTRAGRCIPSACSSASASTPRRRSGCSPSPPASPTHHVPFLAVISLPLLFAAGMIADGHGRRRLHEPGVRLGVLQPGAQASTTTSPSRASRSPWRC